MINLQIRILLQLEISIIIQIMKFIRPKRLYLLLFAALLAYLFCCSFFSKSKEAIQIPKEIPMVQISDLEWTYVNLSKICMDTNGQHVLNDYETFLEDYKVFNSTSNTILDKSLRISGPVVRVKNHDFYFILNPQKRLHLDGTQSSAQPVRPTFLLNLVMISVNNLKQRMTIRKTWANKEAYEDDAIMRTVFICGLSTREEENRKLRFESFVFNDIVQANFVDSYDNLTYKSLLGLKWATSYYDTSNLKFVLKIDDDIVPNMHSFLQYLENRVVYRTKPLRNRFLCRVGRGLKPIRDPSSRYYVAEANYNLTYYPNYCIGPGYTMTVDLAIKLASLSDHQDFIRMEDVYVTGILARKVGATHIDIHSRYNYHPNIISLIKSGTFQETFFSFPVGDRQSYMFAWRYLIKCFSKDSL